MAAVKGKRLNPSVLVAGPPVASTKDIYVVFQKPLPFGEFTLTAGVEVPGAATWTRVEAWVSARRIRKINPGEKFITWLEFTGHSYEEFLKDQERDARASA